MLRNSPPLRNPALSSTRKNIIWPIIDCTIANIFNCFFAHKMKVSGVQKFFFQFHRSFQADTLIWSSPNPLVPAALLQVMSLNPPYLPPRPAALVFEQWPLSRPWTDARLCNCLSLTRTLFPFVTVCVRGPFGSTAAARSFREAQTWWAPNLRL